MGWFTAGVLYVLIWWTVLFAVLPVGTKPVADSQDTAGGWRGAPDNPRLGRKVIATTLISLLIWGASVAVIQSPWLSFRNAAALMPDD